MSTKGTYFSRIRDVFRTAFKGMTLTGSKMRKGLKGGKPLGIEDPDYFKSEDGPVTVQYPAQKIPVPDVGRYRLHMETDDCIACDKCARICPVDCITIESFRATEDLGQTSDGSVKRLHLPVFDIDMAKCMYCGLCTTDCPTECLTMTKVYDFSEFDRDNFVYHFGAMDPVEEVKKREESERILAERKAAKAAAAKDKPAGKKRPMMRRAPAKKQEEGDSVKPRPVTNKSQGAEDSGKAGVEQEKAKAGSGEKKPRPTFKPRPKRQKPIMKRKEPEEEGTEEKKVGSTGADVSGSGTVESGAEGTEGKPVKRSRPVMKKRARPVIPKKEDQEGESEGNAEISTEVSEQAPELEEQKPKARPRPVMKKRPRPVMKPRKPSPPSEEDETPS